ncbi:MAG: M15 family metallopeptidase [Oscillospiraceae bacterium]|nr:M15 family metallopeptidase [Oscillospiraceae bacterium]
MAKTKKKKKNNKAQQQPNYLAQTMDIALTIAVAAGMLYMGYRVVAGGVKIDQGFSEGSSTVTVPEETTEAAPEFQSVETANSVVHEGALILVNNYYALEEEGKNLVSLYDVKMEKESHSFSVRDGDLMVKQEMADSIIAMLDDFYEATYDDNILVISGYRTQEQQQSLYDQYENQEEGEETEQRAAKPGYSEHQTGYGVDLSLYDGSDYDGTGIYSWIDEHCAEYGMILRYPEGKTDQTEIMFEPWHYRYVGVPHASVIMDKGMCLEEYIDYVKEFSFEGEHLMVSDAAGKAYEIYYYPADSNQESTLVPLPTGAENYTIQGNNVDGFIITIETGEAADADPDESAADESSTEDEASSEAPAEESEAAPDAEEAAAENE